MNITDIQIRKIYPEPADIYLNGEYFGTVENDYEFNDLRIQIKQAAATGFSVRFKNVESPINENGRVLNWSNGLFDIFDRQLDILIAP